MKPISQWLINALQWLVSALLFVGLLYGYGSWYSYIERRNSEKRVEENNRRNSKLPVPYRNFSKDFYKETGELLDYAIRDLGYFHFDILSKTNRKEIWENWNVEFRDYLQKKENVLSKFLDRLNSVSNPPEIEFEINSLILDDFSWELECNKIRLSAIEKLYNFYNTNECCWAVQDGKVIYFDESFRKKAEIEKLKYYRLCDRLDKSQEEL